MKMKTITLWQPWASLVAVGAKKIETRSWATNYRGPLAIHAAKKHFDTLFYLDRDLQGFADALNLPNIFRFDVLPLGCVIAICNLIDCPKVINRKFVTGKILTVQLKNGREVTGNELAFGDLSPGRYAWILEDTKRLPEPMPAKGRQGLWNWELPEGVIL